MNQAIAEPLDSPITPSQDDLPGNCAVQSGAEQCTARSKRTGKRCRAAAVTGRTVCYHHGGATPVGFASVSTKEGRFSKHLKGPFKAAYDASAADPDAAGLAAEIRVKDAEITQILERVTLTWDELESRVRAAQDQQSKGEFDPAAFVTDLAQIIANGQKSRAAQRELDAAMHSKAKLAETEARIKVTTGKVATAEQVRDFLIGLAHIHRKHLIDPLPPAQDLIRALADDIRQLPMMQS